MCVCVWLVGIQEHRVYQAALFSFNWDFAKCLCENEGYRLPIPLPSGVDSQLVLEYFFIFATLKARVILFMEHSQKFRVATDWLLYMLCLARYLWWYLNSCASSSLLTPGREQLRLL